jgi:hypothetical protein
MHPLEGLGSRECVSYSYPITRLLRIPVTRFVLRRITSCVRRSLHFKLSSLAFSTFAARTFDPSLPPFLPPSLPPSLPSFLQS